MTLDEGVALLAQVNTLLAPYGCKATELGPDSVGVQGDARAHGPSVFVQFPLGTSQEKIAEISNLITNRAKGITRVLMEISIQ